MSTADTARDMDLLPVALGDLPGDLEVATTERPIGVLEHGYI